MTRFRPLFAASAVLLAALAVVPNVASAEGSRVKAPSFETTNLDGERIVLDDLVGSGPIVFDFWATWCKPCIKELPYIQRLHEEYADQGVQVFAVSTDSPKSQSKVKPFIRGRKFTFPVLFDADGEVFRKLQGKGAIPYVVVLDADGFIRYQHSGYRPGDEKELERVVLELMAESAEVAPPAEAPAG
jgi:peroxiredoxin